MPRSIDETLEPLLQVGQEVPRRVRRIWSGFIDFAIQDNVLEIAIGLILAAAFTTLVTTFVSSILLPPLSLLPFINRNMEEKFAVLRHGPNYHVTSGGYNTLQQALDDGAVVMAYGTFINKLISFLGVGFVLYSLACLYEWGSKDVIIRRTAKCRYCRKDICAQALRCVNCTSWLDGREDHIR